METDFITELLCLVMQKKNTVMNYAQFTIYHDILEKNRIIISINAKYLLKTDLCQFSLVLYFTTKPIQKERLN